MPPSIVVKRGGWSFVWSFVVLFLSCCCVCDLLQHAAPFTLGHSHLEPDRVADFVSQLAADLFRHSGGHTHRRHTPRLRATDLLAVLAVASLHQILCENKHVSMLERACSRETGNSLMGFVHRSVAVACAQSSCRLRISQPPSDTVQQQTRIYVRTGVFA